MELGTRVRIKDNIGWKITDAEYRGVVVSNPMPAEVQLPDELCILLDGHSGGLIFLEDELEVIE